jgi:transcription elongation factor GreB
MSKAFKGEDASDAPLVIPARAPLPPGVDNHVTPRGLAALRAERDRLAQERARLEAEVAGPVEDRGQAQAQSMTALSVRLGALDARIASARVVDPASQPHDEVRFGATVQARSEDGAVRRLTIVGVDEADAASGLIAFVAPLARAFLGRRVGDVAHVRAPRGREDWEIVAIEYDS